MKIVFWLLDLNQEIRDGKPEVWLWGIDESNRRVLLIDEGFLPYFYLVIDPEQNPNDVLERILDLKKDLTLIRDLELLDRSYFGKPVKAIRVVCSEPDTVPVYSRKLDKILGVQMSLEDSIRYVMRYLIDNGIRPCRWHEAEVEETKNNVGISADAVYRVRSPPKFVERAQLPSLRILGFTMIEYSRAGTPKPERDPVVMLTTSTNLGKATQFVADGDDKALIESFIKYVVENDPDIIVGYGTNQRDWPYLLSRSKRLGLRLSVDRVRGEPHSSMYGHISVMGRANVDLFDFADEFADVKVKTLENLADFLEVMKLKDRTIVQETDISSYWEDSERRQVLGKYSLENLQCVMGITSAMLDYAAELSALVGLPLDHIGPAAAGFRVEWVLIREAHRIGELVPEHREVPYFSYEGGLVLEPRPGLHESVAVLDFKSMYPNIMISRNISPDTFVDPKQKEFVEEVVAAPEVGHRFRRYPTGFYSEVLTRLIRARDDVREKLKTLEKGSAEYRMLDARQRAVKIITNASYGYAGWLGARWYLKPVAEATAAWGRYIIKRTIELAEGLGLQVLYGDTDSLFVGYDPERIKSLSEAVEGELGLEMMSGKVYTRVLFTEAKKRYCGLFPDGRLDIVGLEVIRGDWAPVAKNVQEGVLDILLKSKSPQDAAMFAQRYISKLLAKQIPYTDLIIWKTLTKPVSEYAVRSAHVEAAKMLMKAGWELGLGDKVGYVVTLGEGKLYEKAKPYALASYEELDLDYYLKNQVLPAALRILEQFGISRENLLTKAE